MNQIEGYWYAPLNSERFAASLIITAGHYQLVVDGETRLRGEFQEIDVSDRTGNIARRLTFPDSSLFESQDNDGIDAVLDLTNHSAAGIGLLHRLESSWRWVIAGVFVTVFATFGFFKWGLPALSGHVARSLPVGVHESVAAGSMQLLDKFWFEESTLSQAEQDRIQARFDNLIRPLDQENFNFRLYFRQMGGLPNALALPSGEIIVTDALARLADPQEELDAVLMHEIGHVLERHGMQHVVQASTIALIVTLAVGDVSATGDLIVGVPTFLLQSNYSRASESSADQFAFRELTRQGIDPAHFATIILKLSNAGKPVLDKKKTNDDDSPETQDQAEKADYLSTHPDSLSRARKAREYSEKHFTGTPAKVLE